MTVGIYKITNTANGKVYIGSSVNIELRISIHFSNLRSLHCRTNKTMKADFDKCGESAFVWEIIEQITVMDSVFISEREEFWLNKMRESGIETYNSKNPSRRYTYDKKQFKICDICGGGYYEPNKKHDHIQKRKKLGQLMNIELDVQLVKQLKKMSLDKRSQIIEQLLKQHYQL
jgi:group I intron endonuclease